MNVDILFRAASTENFFLAMESLGVPVFRENEKPEEQLGAASGQPLVTHQGVVRWVRMVPEYLDRIPDIILSPETVMIDKRTDEVYEEDYEPSYTADLTDADGDLYVGTVYPGRIAN